MLNALRHLDTSSEFVVIGLFAIIEMLITHNPKLEDRGDSITHQMQTKIPLLSRRFKRELPTHSYFGDADDAKIWTAMYAYRSAVAHGGVADFTKKLSLLKNPENANNYLRLAVRSLLRQAFEEPELYRDLKKC